ncbi:MAG TPA: hypothetical protein VHQ42_00015 [Candidatus Limnocylindria bacterium]|nr:hypothetical protein [Candidatus Limnocylindria bacterium]
MGLILDLAVAALALIVIGSLALLAWTLAVTAVRATHRARQRVAFERRAVTDAEQRLRTSAARTTAALEELRRRTQPQNAHRYAPPGEPPDA